MYYTTYGDVQYVHRAGLGMQIYAWYLKEGGGSNNKWNEIMKKIKHDSLLLWMLLA